MATPTDPVTVWAMDRLAGSRFLTLLDAAAVVFITVAWESQVFSSGQGPGTHVAGPRWLTAPLPLLIALPLLWRRRAPLLGCSLVLAGISLQAVVSGDSPEGLGLILLWLLVPFSVAAYGRRRQGLVGLGLTLTAFGLYAAENADITSGRADDLWAGAFFLIVAVGSWLVGAVVRGRRERASLQAHASLVEREARLAVDEERSRIARELHDIVSHNLSVVVVQAAGARAQAAPDTGDASTLEKIERSGREALVEMRRLLGVLRRDGDDHESSLSPSPGVDQLPGLAQRLRGAGLDVTLELETDGSALSPAVDLSAYRIVQEALTNTLKHAGPQAGVLVKVGHDADAVTVEVLDDGAGHQPREPSAADGGHGLIGMRERAALFGGEVHAGPRPGGGFTVRARLPLDPSSRR
ncbi:MAG: sensor histidine kinase [Thermoleophilaceae bacterium]